MDVKNVALNKALGLLNALGLKYKVIDIDGNEYGELKVMPEPSSKRIRRLPYPRGHLAAYAKQYVNTNLNVGDVAFIPMSNIFDTKDVAHAAGKLMYQYFGMGSYVTEIGDSGVEVLRVQ